MKTETEIWTLGEDEVIVQKGEKKEVRKESKQVKSEFDGLQIKEPRYKFSDLLYFMDVNTWHKRCIFLKAAVTGGLGWQLVTDDENKEPDEAYNRIKAFLNRPNPNFNDNFSRIIYKMLIDYYALGNGWLELVRNVKGEAAELYHIPARTMRRRADFKGYWQVRTFKKVEFANFGDPNRTTRNEVLHHFTYDPNDDYYGAPEWLPVMAGMALDRSAVEYNTYQFENGMMASFAITIKGGELSPKARAALRKFLQTNYKGIKNAGRVIVISNDDPNVEIKIEKLDLEGAARDMSFLRSRQFGRDEVISAHAVPPRMVGVMAAGQLGGAGEIAGQLKTFKEIVIAPEQEYLENYLNNTILATFGEHKWRLAFNQMDITDLKDDAEYYEKMVGIGALTADEVREEIGKPPLVAQAGPNLEKRLARHLALINKALEGYDGGME